MKTISVEAFILSLCSDLSLGSQDGYTTHKAGTHPGSNQPVNTRVWTQICPHNLVNSRKETRDFNQLKYVNSRVLNQLRHVS